MYNLAVDADLVAAARDGSHQALEDLVGRSLPLVYNVVGRALPGRSEIDDVVQETMLRIIRGLPVLRDVCAYRSWLVAVTMNQLRQHYRTRPTSLLAPEDVSLLADPGADFVHLTLLQLGLSGQRQETVEATRWLGEDDRQLLSLWWLVTAGHLPRAEMVEAVGLSDDLVTERVSRMKAQLETSRLVVRALAAVPRCGELGEVLNLWEGQPSPLWCKRIAPHLRQCDNCGVLAEGMIEPEKLLAGLALVPVPVGYGARIVAQLPHDAISATATTAMDVPAPVRVGARHASRAGRARAGNPLTALAGKPVLAVAAVVATATGAWGVAALISSSGGKTDGLTMTGQATSAQSSAPETTPSASLSSTFAVVATPTSTSAQTHKPSSPHTRTTLSSSHSPTPSTPYTSSPKPSAPGTSAPTAPGPPSTSVPSTSSAVSNTPADQVLALINKARAAQGLRPYYIDPKMTAVADKHNRLMIGGCGFNHVCAGEPDPCVRDAGPDGPGNWCGENIAAVGPWVSDNSDDGLARRALALAQGFLDEGPDGGHHYNLLSPVHVSIGISIIWDQGRVWMTQEFSDS